MHSLLYRGGKKAQKKPYFLVKLTVKKVKKYKKAQKAIDKIRGGGYNSYYYLHAVVRVWGNKKGGHRNDKKVFH